MILLSNYIGVNVDTERDAIRLGQCFKSSCLSFMIDLAVILSSDTFLSMQINKKNHIC